MFITEDIRRVSIVVFREDYTRVMASLGDAGILHCVAQGSGGVSQEAADIYASVRMISIRLEAVARDIFPVIYGSVSREIAGGDVAERDHAVDEIFLCRIERQFNRYRVLDEIFAKEISSQQKMIDERSDLANIPFLPKTSFLKSVRGYISGECPDSGNDCYIVRGNRAVVAMCLPSYWGEMMSALRSAGFEQADGRDMKEEHELLLARCEYLKKRRKDLGIIMGEKRAEWEKTVKQLLSVYPTLEQMDHEGQKWIYLKNLILMGGWIEKKQEARMMELLQRTAAKGFYCHMYGRLESMRGNPPVRLKNNLLVKPFEILVKSMGMPRNSEIDPTPLAGIIYIVLFGMMFGDLGQGLVLVLSGLLVYLYGRSHNSENRFLGGMLAYCGASTMVWGILYGSVFSNENLLKALLFHPSERIMDLFLLAVATGALCITIALTLNVINTFLGEGLAHVVLNHGALPALMLYGGGIYMVWHYVTYKFFPGVSLVWVVMALAFFIMVFRGPLAALMIPGTRSFPYGIGEYVVETIADMVEMFSSFIANTISFIRAGAFALSHAGLGFAFFSLASILPGGLFGPAGIGVIVLGNVFIILLEGLLCGIQSMRLEYYELFSRFYRGDGVEFSPFRFTRIIPRGGVT